MWILYSAKHNIMIIWNFNVMHTWNLRMIVHISPKLRRGLPSTMSYEPMFSRWILWSRSNSKALCTFSRQWIRILPFVGRCCRRQEHNYTTQSTYTHDTNTSQSRHIAFFLKHTNTILQKNRHLYYHMTVKNNCYDISMGTMTSTTVQHEMHDQNTHRLLPRSAPLTSKYGLKHRCSFNKETKTWH